MLIRTSGCIIQTKTKRYDSGQVASLKDALHDLDNFQVGIFHEESQLLVTFLAASKYSIPFELQERPLYKGPPEDKLHLALTLEQVKEALYQQALEQVGPVDLPLGWSMRMSRSRNQV